MTMCISLYSSSEKTERKTSRKQRLKINEERRLRFPFFFSCNGQKDIFAQEFSLLFSHIPNSSVNPRTMISKLPQFFYHMALETSKTLKNDLIT